MSAFVVSPEHIKELVAYAVSRSNYDRFNVDPRYLSYHVSDGLKNQLADLMEQNYLDYELATIYAGVLYSENLRSVAYRYDDCKTIDDLPGLIEKLHFITMNTEDIMYHKVRNPVHLLKMCNCLEYQSCETDDYRQSDAYQLLSHIKESLITKLPGYEDAPWDYNKRVKV